MCWLGFNRSVSGLASGSSKFGERYGNGGKHRVGGMAFQLKGTDGNSGLFSAQVTVYYKACADGLSPFISSSG